MQRWGSGWFAFLLLVLAACSNDGPSNGDGNPPGGPGNPPPGGPDNPPQQNYVLTAWNDLGMHCMDADYSVFAILPPYNNLHAQIKKKDGGLLTQGVVLSYEATTGTDGKINTHSQGKTNFWNYAQAFFGTELPPDVGLAGKPTPSTDPAALDFDPTRGWWAAEGLPLTPYNDDGSKNFYPIVKVVARDAASGEVLASANVVLPVSDEMDCRLCHGSSAARGDAKPGGGWVNDPNPEKDYRLNILRLHDEKHEGAVRDRLDQLRSLGYDYDPAGLEATARSGTPVLCAACHESNALPGVGLGIKPFTNAIHKKHANVVDPVTGRKLDDLANRGSCYNCHPGAVTACLRGAMGDARNADGSLKMQCQSCHGPMSQVGDRNREGWLDEPNCQACHFDGRRATSAIDPATGRLRMVSDVRFATNPDTPLPGFSLYRYSTGHGGLQCEACHGATHAVYPAHEADNLLSISIQGHTGTVAECTACHDPPPRTELKGPHGLHTVGQWWVDRHGDAAEHDPSACQACHGSDYRGSPLSAVWSDRSFLVEERGTKTFARGDRVGCYDCHDGPHGDAAARASRPGADF